MLTKTVRSSLRNRVVIDSFPSSLVCRARLCQWGVKSWTSQPDFLFETRLLGPGNSRESDDQQKWRDALLSAGRAVRGPHRSDGRGQIQDRSFVIFEFDAAKGEMTITRAGQKRVFRKQE